MTPTITTTHQRLLIGKSLTMSLTDNKTAQLWQSFIPQIPLIPNRIDQNKISMAIYEADYFGSFSPARLFDKWAAVEVNTFNIIPDNLQSFKIPAGMYAVFQYKGLSSDNSIFHYIFSEWLPKSGYRLDNRPHFEILGDKYQNNHPDSEEEIWIPVKIG